MKPLKVEFSGSFTVDAETAEEAIGKVESGDAWCGEESLCERCNIDGAEEAK